MLIDPHTAVGIGVTKKISLKGNTVVLATAHPSKFSDVVMEATGIRPELPDNLKNILVEKENYDKLPKDLEKVKNYIIERMQVKIKEGENLPAKVMEFLLKEAKWEEAK